jgi:dehydratase
MKPTTARRARVFVAALLALTPAVASAIPASAATQTAAFRCRAAGMTGSFEAALSQEIDSKAPSTVVPGKDTTIVLAPSARSVPTLGGSLKELKDITLKVPFPTSSTYRSSSLSGGFGLGHVTLRESDQALIITATGPVPGGADYQLPTLKITVTANDRGDIQSILGGTSFDDPGLTFTAVARLDADADVATSCYPDRNLILTSTTITSSSVAAR